MEQAIIKRCTLDDLVVAPNWSSLLDEYSAESAMDGLGSQNMQLDTYRAMEASGVLHMVGAWIGDELVGVISAVISPLPHYGKLICIGESFFVASAHRKSGAGTLLRREIECIGEESGAVGVLMTAPKGGRLAKVLPLCGYRHTNEVFFKPLGQIAARAETLPAMTGEAIDKVRKAEASALELPQIDLPIQHNLHAGMYARTVTVPAGMVITGALIKIPTLLIVDGHCDVFTGAETVVLEGRHVIQASANRKQAFLAHTDTHLTMLFPTSATTVEQAENEFTDEADMLQTRRPQGDFKCLES